MSFSENLLSNLDNLTLLKNPKMLFKTLSLSVPISMLASGISVEVVDNFTQNEYMINLSIQSGKVFGGLLGFSLSHYFLNKDFLLDEQKNFDKLKYFGDLVSVMSLNAPVGKLNTFLLSPLITAYILKEGYSNVDSAYLSTFITGMTNVSILSLISYPLSKKFNSK